MIFPNTIIPDASLDDESFSVDVFTCDDDGMMNVGYYDFKLNQWTFHTDTMKDYYEGGVLQPFVWMYKPENLKVS